LVESSADRRTRERSFIEKKMRAGAPIQKITFSQAGR
jgi:hypothetical protein